MNHPRIAVIGAAAVDVKAHSFGALVRRGDVPGRVRLTLGGVGRNIAKNLALLGAEVTFISAVGDDEFGRWLQRDLSGAGVNLAHLLIAGSRTATWVGIIDARGDLDVGVFGGEILDALTPDFIRERQAAIADSDLIALDATLPRAAIDALLEIGRAHHIPLYLNPASIARAQTVADCVGAFDLITANALEAQVWVGNSTATASDAARTLIAKGTQRAIITLGGKGIVYADADTTRHESAHATTIVDTTGAGDALAAIFLLCHLQGRGLDETLHRALDAAAITVACEESVSEKIGEICADNKVGS